MNGAERDKLPAKIKRVIRHTATLVFDALRLIANTVCKHLSIDWPIAFLAALYLAVFIPGIARYSDNPPMLAAYSNDEPWLTMALEATIVRPYGNPANYFDMSRPTYAAIPDHWAGMRYPGIIYYGGALFQLAAPPYALLRAVGMPAFPTGPILLRSIVLGAGLLSLILLYNIGKQRGFPAAGFFAAALFAFDPSIIYYSSNIHPDTLQVLFGLCMFLLAVEHAKTGSSASLIALGLLCGIIQGTKAGGAWTVPTAFVAMGLGFAAASSKQAVGGAMLGRITAKILALGLAALAGFLISTPYAFVDGYYLRSFEAHIKYMTGDPLQQATSVTFFGWTKTIHEYIGWFGTGLLFLTIARATKRNLPNPRDPALLLGLVLGASQWVAFGAGIRMWSVFGYLALGYVLLAVFCFESALVALNLAVDWLQKLLTNGPEIRQPVRIAAISAFAIMFVFAFWHPPLISLVRSITWQSNTSIAANRWAIDQNVPRDAVIVSDDLAYFDRSRFPNARLHGGVFTWSAAKQLDPDYIVLSSSLFGAPWMQNLIQVQRLDRFDPDSFNVRLYQDLLRAEVLGPTSVPGFELLTIVRPVPLPDEQKSSLLSHIAGMCQAPKACKWPFSFLAEQIQLGAQVYRSASFARHAKIDGPELRIFRVNKTVSADERYRH